MGKRKGVYFAEGASSLLLQYKGSKGYLSVEERVKNY